MCSVVGVRSGFCRSGSWWGYQGRDFGQDIVTMGKPMGNGLALAGVVASKELVDNYHKHSRYFTTFASSPLQAAVGMAVLEVIESEGLRESVAEVGAYMRRELELLQAECEPMADVRGYGLFMALEWGEDREARTPDREGAVRVANQMNDKGFLICNAGARRTVLTIRPPVGCPRAHAAPSLAELAPPAPGLARSGAGIRVTVCCRLPVKRWCTGIFAREASSLFRHPRTRCSRC